MSQQLCLLFLILAGTSAKSVEIGKSRDAFEFVISNGETETLDWWAAATFYQIYPLSFMDSDNDGYGDLQGIISRLDHLKDSGITATWLSPIYQSPQVDQGYDISDFYTIDPLFGTLDDFKELVTKANALGIKIVLDFVVDYTSDQHKWFQLSENRTAGYEDYYVWHDGIQDPNNASNILPPNNWISIFRGPMWTWSEKRQQFYLHQFTVQQPDLNYSNPSVVQEMKDVLTYWMNLGVDGFRIDAVPTLFEDPDFRDEPLVAGATYDVNNYGCLDHIYTADLNDTFDMVYQWRSHVDAYARNNSRDTIVLMTEAYSSADKTARYYGTYDHSRLGAHFSFNFHLITDLPEQDFTAFHILKAISTWVLNIYPGYVSNWVLGNHDRHRVATRFGKENVDAFNMLVAILPGVMVTYNGEEIGMENGEVTCAQGWDPSATKDCSTFNETSRDFERTPFQWDDSVNAGFSKANNTWLPVSEKYRTLNLAAQINTSDTTHYKIYKQLMEFRKNFRVYSVFDGVGAEVYDTSILYIQRERMDDEYNFIFNIGPSDKNVTLPTLGNKTYTVAVTSSNSSLQVGDIVTEVLLKPHESIIFMVQSSSTTTGHVKLA